MIAHGCSLFRRILALTIFLLMIISFRQQFVSYGEKKIFTHHQANRTIKYIFSLSEWRSLYDSTIFQDNRSLCDVPIHVEPIANEFCRSILRRPCPKLPCQFVFLSTKDIIIDVLSDGRRSHTPGDVGVQHSDETKQIRCVKSSALELFTWGPPYPSVTTDGYVRISREFLVDFLSRSYRSRESIWSLTLTGESTGYYPVSGSRTILSLFDITIGFNRRLYHIAEAQYLHPYIKQIQNQSRLSFRDTIESKRKSPKYVTAPILWMNANCHALSNRTGYMRELMSYIPVDAWGSCCRNKGPELPKEIAQIQGTPPNVSHFLGKWSAAKMAMMKSYLFTIAIENSFEYDYVTEKLWQPLAAGSVPIYYGAPNIDDWLPCTNCIVDLRQFANPKLAAQYLREISNDMNRYQEFHRWREQPISPKFQRIIDYLQRKDGYSIDSITCAMAHSNHPAIIRHNILNDIEPVF